MQYNLLVRKEHFGATVFDAKEGKRVYLNKEELKNLEEKNILPSDVGIDITDKKIKVVTNHNIDKNDMFSFADTVFIELTRKCNLRCIHCLNNSGVELPGQITKEEVFDLVKNLIDAGVQEIRFTGGEPLLFDGLYECIKMATDNGLRTSLGTNGVLATPEVAKKLKEAGLNSVVVSLDGTKETHDTIRGAGNFERSLRGLFNLKEVGIDVRVNSVIMKNNIKEIITLAKDLNSKGVKLFIRQFVSSGRGENLSDLALSSEEYKQVKESLKTELSEFVQGHNLKNNNGTTSRINLDFVISTCRAGQRTLDITPDGNIYPCGFLAAQGFSKVGNIREVKDWVQFWYDLNNYPRLKDLRQKMNKYNLENERKINCLADFYSKIKNNN